MGRHGAHHPDRLGREPGRSSRGRGDQSRLCADPAVLAGQRRPVDAPTDPGGRQPGPPGLDRDHVRPHTSLRVRADAAVHHDRRDPRAGHRRGSVRCAADAVRPPAVALRADAAVEPRPAPRPVGPAAGRRGFGAVGALVDVSAALRPAARDAARRLRHDRRRARTPTTRAAPAADRAAPRPRRALPPRLLVEPDHAPPRACAPRRRPPADRGLRRDAGLDGVADRLQRAADRCGVPRRCDRRGVVRVLRGGRDSRVGRPPRRSGPHVRPAHHARGPRGGAREQLAGLRHPHPLWFASASSSAVCARSWCSLLPRPAGSTWTGVYGGGDAPLVLVVASGAAIALAGVFFRPWAQRRRTAWSAADPRCS